MSKKENQEEQDPRESLRNFVVTSKVDAFVSQYEPCDDIYSQDAIVLSEAELRKRFGAYVKTVGDPLVIYIDEILFEKGFRMMVNDLTGDLVMCVRERL